MIAANLRERNYCHEHAKRIPVQYRFAVVKRTGPLIQRTDPALGIVGTGYVFRLRVDLIDADIEDKMTIPT
jgi:hypothetical protein